ncbi:hypothetical protein CROQUDRAFT_92203 [Cronartium quercuum f. sp. fusiforme G11]|uniref:Myb-like domain-containing protein n=1 Tax=Cronartium quercuum f. sp. fusiforme G11 TaxID=708437 RepID=A0A9P6TBX9_9BASI|nr:hypothetical protein CROQUDRAFT_92203 [Cronartium quercuum f. sp. fusiforme G11]
MSSFHSPSQSSVATTTSTTSTTHNEIETRTRTRTRKRKSQSRSSWPFILISSYLSDLVDPFDQSDTHHDPQKEPIDHSLIHFCDLKSEQHQDSHPSSPTFQSNGLNYIIDHSINPLTLSHPPELFETTETVQALERILNSHLFEIASHQPQTNGNEISSSLNHTLPPQENSQEDSDSNILNNEELFKAAAACFEQADRSQLEGLDYDQIGVTSDINQQTDALGSIDEDSTLDSMGVDESEPLRIPSGDMPIDPRLHESFSIADEFMNPFEASSSSFPDHDATESAPAHELQPSSIPCTIDLCESLLVDEIPFGPSNVQSGQAFGSYKPLSVDPSPAPTRRLRARPPKPSTSSRPSRRRPSSSISAMLINGQPGARVNTPLKLEANPDTITETFHDPNVHPLLQSLPFDTFPRSPSPPRKRHRSNTSNLTLPPLNTSSALLELTRIKVDVHGAGAGGGAAAILSASASTNLPLTTDLLSNYVRKRITTSPIPESYNPDQYRSFNRIHWTKSEEELLVAEVEMNWERYDCMAQIMKRHGPMGTISKTFADRTGVSLKDKAVNISSRWYRDGTELEDLRKRAFARFRPKQLRGKLRSELPGMLKLSTTNDDDDDDDDDKNNINNNKIEHSPEP